MLWAWGCLHVVRAASTSVLSGTKAGVLESVLLHPHLECGLTEQLECASRTAGAGSALHMSSVPVWGGLGGDGV